MYFKFENTRMFRTPMDKLYFKFGFTTVAPRMPVQSDGGAWRESCCSRFEGRGFLIAGRSSGWIAMEVSKSRSGANERV